MSWLAYALAIWVGLPFVIYLAIGLGRWYNKRKSAS